MKDIFNADETGIFFKALPNKTLEFKGNDCKGTKLSKAMNSRPTERPFYHLYSIETNIEDKDLDAVKKVLLMTGEHHISPKDYVNIDNSTDTTFISQSENISKYIVKEFLINKEKWEKEEENITTNEILFYDNGMFLIMENFILHKILLMSF